MTRRMTRVRHPSSAAPWARAMSIRSVLAVCCVCAALVPALAGAEAGQSTARAAPTVQRAAEAKPQPPLRLFRAWLAAFNSGDRARYAKFLKHNWPTWVWLIDRDLGLRQVTSGFTLRKVGGTSATRVSPVAVSMRQAPST